MTQTATIKITQRMLNKSIIDANKSVVDFVKECLPIDYDDLLYNLKAGLKPRIQYRSMYTDGSDTEVRLYLRPRGDKLLSIKHISKKVTAGDTVTFTSITGEASSNNNYYVCVDITKGDTANG